MEKKEELKVAHKSAATSEVFQLVLAGQESDATIYERTITIIEFITTIKQIMTMTLT